MFPWVMVGIILVFFELDWPVKLFGRVRQVFSSPEALPGFARQPSLPRHQDWRVGIAIAAAALFLLFQVALPLRHYAYPGNVRWTEEGYLFAWRMMLTEKTGHVVYRVNGTIDTEEEMVYPEEYLTPSQVERMSYQPDLILATAI